MVGHKCVQFQANGAKKPGGYRKFQETEDMTNIDLRNVQSVEEDVKIEKSRKGKTCRDSLRKTCIRTLIITIFVVFGSLTLLAIFSRTEIENLKDFWPLRLTKEANVNSGNSTNLPVAHEEEFNTCRNNKSLQNCCLMLGYTNNVTIIQNCSLMDDLAYDISKDIVKFKEFLVKLKNKLFSSFRNFNPVAIEDDWSSNILDGETNLENSTNSQLSTEEADENQINAKIFKTDKSINRDKNLVGYDGNNISTIIKNKNTRDRRSYEWYRREVDKENIARDSEERSLYKNGENNKNFEPLLYYEPNILAEVFQQKGYQNRHKPIESENNNIYLQLPISNDNSFDNYETAMKRNDDVYTDNLDPKVSNELDQNSDDMKKEDSDTLRINIGSHLSGKNKPQFTINSNDIPNLLDSSYLQKQCVPYTPQVGSAFPILPPYVSYPYDPNSKFTQLLPMPKQTLNPFFINPQYANANYQTMPNMYSLNQPYYWSQNIQNPSGQYYLCNPVTASVTNQLTNIPGVEVRESSNTEEPAEEINDKTRTLRRCPIGKVSCSRDNKCIMQTQICDSQVDCPDASDEMFCSCPERIKEDRLCDGYFDCPNGEDEIGCFGCSSDNVSCNRWTSDDIKASCIPKEQRCDGVSQCTSGQDEEDCSILLESYETPSSLFQVSTAKGFLFRIYKGTWYPVCSDPEQWSSEICEKETGKNEFPPLTYTVPIQTNYKGSYLKKLPDGDVKVVDYCFNGFAIYVECPSPKCGLRNLLEESYQGQEDSDESMDDEISRFGRARTNDTDLLELSRVVGGNPSQPAAWPWVVSIYRNGLFHCGGVIINDNWVITAAHCVDRFIHYYYEIEAGILRRFSYSPMQQTRVVSHVVSHNAYDRANLKNDLAMMKLSRPLIYSRYVRPICLPALLTAGINYLREPFPGTYCTAVGWGATIEHGTDPDRLREVEVPVLDECKHREDEEGHEICAGFSDGGRDACQGDSGGPFMCKNPNLPEQWYLAGIVSHGEGCARPNEPGVYTRVSLYLDWLYTHLNNGILPKRRPLQKCPGYSCKASDKCLPIKRRCDRIVDCLLGDDELNCDQNLVNKLFRNALKHMILVDSVQNDTAKEDKSNLLDFETTDAVATKESTTSITTSESTLTTVPPDNISGTTFKMENTPTPKHSNRSDFGYTIEENTSFASSSTISDDGQSISYDQTTPTTIVYSTSAKIARKMFDKDADTVDVKGNDVFTSSGDEHGNVTPSGSVEDHFKCIRMLQVIPLSKRCDKIADCEDVSDEENCNCADYMRHLHPEGICDGSVDCYDLSDEQNCEKPCKKDEFHCTSNNACIPLDKKCDSYRDCPHNEDEHYCFALTDGTAVVLDENLRPHLNTNGVVTFYYRGSWVPMCDDNETEMQSAVASEVCLTLGLLDYIRYFQVEIRNKPLNIVTNWGNQHSNVDGQYEKFIVGDEAVCKVLYVRCSNDTVRWYEQGITDLYPAPWDGAIYVDGEYKCTGTLLNSNWVLTSYNCFRGMQQLDLHYVTVLLGINGGYLDITGPHEKIKYVTKTIPVLYSDVFLLKLAQNVSYTRYIRPLRFTMQNDLYRLKETCYATGRNKENKLVSVQLTRTLNCTANSRCFKRTSPIYRECENTEKHWSGTIICESGQGYYPLAVFYEENGLCGFQRTTPFTSLSIFKKNMFDIMENMEISTIYQKECEGFRCALGKCIEPRRICDGIQDCRAGEDENELTCYTRNTYCHLTNNCACTKQQLTCNDGKCVPKSAFCNKINDCSDESDEPDVCNCFEYLKMTNPDKICDGVRHCHDRTDENPEICSCEVGKYLCAQSRHCIPMEMVCDGYPDCPNNEDEQECMKLRTFSNSVNAGEVLVRTTGVWHQGCFEENLTKQEIDEICQHLGYIDNNASYIKSLDTSKRLAPRPVFDPFNVVWLNKGPDIKFKLAMRNGDKPFISFVNSTDCYRLFIQC